MGQFAWLNLQCFTRSSPEAVEASRTMLRKGPVTTCGKVPGSAKSISHWRMKWDK